MQGRCLWACLLLVTLTGCGVEINQPLSDPTTSEADASLYGHWIGTDPKNPTREEHVFIGTHKVESHPESIMEATWLFWDSGSKTMSLRLKKGAAYFTSTEINNNTYINFLDVQNGNDFESADLDAPADYQKWVEDEHHMCSVIMYKCDGKRLEIWDIDDWPKKLEMLKDRGELKTAKGLVTAESLSRYLHTNGGASLFGRKSMTFTKVN
jgi:hypothetical protein